MIIHDLRPLLHIISLQRSVIHYRISVEPTVVWLPTELIRRVILLEQRMSKDLRTIASVLREGLPDPLHGLVGQSVELVLVVNSGEDDGLETHFGEEVLVGGGVAEGVDVPAHSGGGVEFVEEELMAFAHVLDDVEVVRTCLVVHGPAAAHKF